ncbi:MAG TPA: L,D-transpeptidase family protein [Nocardioides sp.]|uniref:L,D-transpeptidase family protein n=1 Tax=Nocardioides sp. TaxID=35761 RepID=UPI002F41CABE
MRKLGLLVVVLAATLAAVPAPAHADVRYVTLGGVRVALHEHTRQVVTVNHTRGYRARIAYWVQRHGRWHRVYAVHDGRIGYGGLVRPRLRQQGSGTTPLGTTRLISAFGRHARGDSWDLPYRRIRRGDYWVEDNRSQYYNRYRNKSRGGFRWWLPAGDVNSSERLRDYPVQYEYSVVTSYNHAQVRHRGAGIFLHVNGRGATAGCVSAPRWFLQRMMWRLDPVKDPVMAVGR